MFAWPGTWLIVVSRLAPLAFEVFALVTALNAGLNLSALQLPTWNGVDTFCVAPNVDVSVDSSRERAAVGRVEQEALLVDRDADARAGAPARP